MNTDVFQIKSVSKVFGQNAETQVHALDQVDLNIQKGEFTALVGPSGSGKSTLLNIMSGLDTPTHGHVILSGEKIEDLTGDEMSVIRRDHIGFIFQSYNLIPVLTVKENIEYVMALQGIKQGDRDSRVSEFLKVVGLEGKEGRFPNELSGGQQQRVAVARAMVSRPDIIMADEPTANLDSETGTKLVEMMLQLNIDYGTTFVFSTHDPIIMEKAKRLVTLKDGKIISDELR
jgi:putative ABC transport system ATP-binding protein